MALISFLIPLGLTLFLEGLVALVWRFRGKDWLLFVLVNILTNPAAVLIHAVFPGWTATAVLELSVVAVEGFCYRRFGGNIRRPWLFALTANVFSYGCGLLSIIF